MFSIDFSLPRHIACTDRMLIKSVVQNDLIDINLNVELDLGNNMDALDSENLLLNQYSIKGDLSVAE